MTNIQICADLLNGLCLGIDCKRRCPSNHSDIRHSRQGIEDFFRHAIGKIALIVFRTEIVKRQDCNSRRNIRLIREICRIWTCRDQPIAAFGYRFDIGAFIETPKGLSQKRNGSRQAVVSCLIVVPDFIKQSDAFNYVTTAHFQTEQDLHHLGFKRHTVLATRNYIARRHHAALPNRECFHLCPTNQ